MTSEQGAEPAPTMTRPDASTIIRDALVLQAKLVVDGLRDAILIPVSLFAALISIFLPGDGRRLFFYEVVHAGRRSERWINLFVAAERFFPEAAGRDDAAGLDDLLEQVESQLRTQYSDSEANKAASDERETVLDKIRAARRRFARQAESGKDI